MRLREYQERAVSDVRAAYATHRAVCLAAPTGAGKTVIICEVVRRALAAGRRVLFVVHRIELVEQARDRLAAFGIPCGVIKAGITEDRSQPVQIACVPSLIRREFPPADLVILDEAHHAKSDSWMRVAEHYADSWILGATATPTRLDGKPLGDIFDHIVEPVTTADLVAQGHLIEPTVWAPPGPDLRGVKKRGGDYALPELAERMEKLTGSITDYWTRYCQGRRAIGFAVNIDHSVRIAEALAGVGARAVHIDGSTRKDGRRDAALALRAHDLDVVVQVGLWTEGVDLPEVDGLIIARPTASMSLHRQIVGRVMRTAPGKTDALVLDHAGNHHTHGAVTDPVVWSLTGRPEREPVPSLSTCPECFAILDPGWTVCPQCGYVRQARDEVDPPPVDAPGELVKLNRTTSKQDKAYYYEAQVQTASANGYKLGWARMRYKERFGVWPRFRAMEEELYRCRSHDWRTKTYGPRAVQQCAACFVVADD